MLASRIRPSRCWLASLLFVSALSVAAPFAYVAGGRDVSVIDTASNTIIATVPQAGWGPIAANPAGALTYVANSSGSLFIIDTANNAVIGKVPLENPAIPYGIAIHPDGTRAYVSFYQWDIGDNSVSVIDLTTKTVAATVPLGFSPGGIEVNRAGTRLYVADYDGNAIVVIDAVTYSVLARIASPAGADKVAMNAAGTRLYVTGNNGLSIIDTATNAVVATAGVGGSASAVAVNHAGTRFYVSTYLGGTYPNNDLYSLVIVDAATLDVIANVPVGSLPTAVAIDPTDTRVYVTNYYSNNLSVVDTATNTVVATIPVSAPLGVVVIAGPAAFDLNRRGLTGSWYQPATNGQGVELEVYEDMVASGAGYLQGAWFTYDYKAAGGAASQRWYTFGGSVRTGQSSATVPLYQNVGGSFNALPASSAVQVGSAVLTAADCTHITMAYTFTDGSARSGTITLGRVTPATCSSGSTSASNADFGYSGNWFDSTTSGQGLVLDVNYGDSGPFISSAWYTYAPDGEALGEAGQRWYTGLGFYAPGAGTMPMDLYETTGGLFDKAAPVPSKVSVGTSTLTFTSCSAATLSFNFTRGSSAGASGTINLSRVGPTPAGCRP